jgi:hypothetical protein
MKITKTDIKILLDFLPNFEISNSDWGTEFIKRLEDQKTPPLTNQEKDISDWEQYW